MPISRFLFFFSKRTPSQARNLFPRRIQSSSYSQSTRQSNGKRGGHPIMPAETEASRSYVFPAATTVAAALGFAGIVAFLHYNDERRAIPKGQGNNPGCFNVKGPSIGGPFTLTDSKNRVVTEEDLRGNWVLLHFGYTSSPDVGPEQLQVIAKAISALESKENVKILPIFVTIDPQRDTPAHLHAYLKEFDSRIVGLTGDVASVRQMAQQYRVPFKKVYEERDDDYLIESSHCMYLMNPNIEIVRCFGVEYNAEQLAETIAEEIKRRS